MKKVKLVQMSLATVTALLMTTSYGYCFGWPTFDVSKVVSAINTFQTSVQENLSTIDGTLALTETYHAIGDNVASATQFVNDVKEQKEALLEEAEKNQARAERLQKLKEQYASQYFSDDDDEYDSESGSAEASSSGVSDESNYSSDEEDFNEYSWDESVGSESGTSENTSSSENTLTIPEENFQASTQNISTRKTFSQTSEQVLDSTKISDAFDDKLLTGDLSIGGSSGGESGGTSGNSSSETESKSNSNSGDTSDTSGGTLTVPTDDGISHNVTLPTPTVETTLSSDSQKLTLDPNVSFQPVGNVSFGKTLDDGDTSDSQKLTLDPNISFQPISNVSFGKTLDDGDTSDSQKLTLDPNVSFQPVGNVSFGKTLDSGDTSNTSGGTLTVPTDDGISHNVTLPTPTVETTLSSDSQKLTLDPNVSFQPVGNVSFGKTLDDGDTSNTSGGTLTVPTDDGTGLRRTFGGIKFKIRKTTVDGDKVSSVEPFSMSWSQPMSFGQESSEYRTGTLDNGKFVFADEIATRCKIGWKGGEGTEKQAETKFTDKMMRECFQVWVKGLNDSEQATRNEWVNAHQKAENDHSANDMATALINKVYSATFAETVLTDIKTKAEGVSAEKDEVSYFAAVTRVNQEVIIKLLESLASRTITESWAGVRQMDKNYIEEDSSSSETTEEGAE